MAGFVPPPFAPVGGIEDHQTVAGPEEEAAIERWPRERRLGLVAPAFAPSSRRSARTVPSSNETNTVSLTTVGAVPTKPALSTGGVDERQTVLPSAAFTAATNPPLSADPPTYTVPSAAVGVAVRAPTSVVQRRAPDADATESIAIDRTRSRRVFSEGTIFFPSIFLLLSHIINTNRRILIN